MSATIFPLKSELQVFPQLSELLPVAPLWPLFYEPVIRNALIEDLGNAGDLTTDSLIPEQALVDAHLVARSAGRIAGLVALSTAFNILDPTVKVDIIIPDGADVAVGDLVAVISGRARPILTVERTVLNLINRMCGIATETSKVVEKIADLPARIVCTRKTTPGLRALEKYAVRLGGGINHRFGLDDAILIKDNHLVVVRDLKLAMERARNRLGHMVKIEVEVDTLEQLETLLPLGADAVLFDNMPTPVLRKAIVIVAGRMLTEASGGITPDSVREIAETGVDLISLGWLTSSVCNFDIGLDFVV